ncbi:MAG TPA: phosphopantetheine-binding protein [Verrucomicrobiae bacterium]
MPSLPGSTIGSRTDSQVIAEQLCQFARANLVADGADFDEHSSLAAVGIDSFLLVELLLFAERVFGVTVPESHLTREHLASLSALARCIAQLAGGSPPPPEAAG